jgi:hypothetical protein
VRTPGQQQLPRGTPLGRHGRGSRCCWCRPWPPRCADLANGAASATGGTATHAGRARGHRAPDDAAAHASGSQGVRAVAANARRPVRRPQGGLAADAVSPYRAHAVRGTDSIGVDARAPAGLRSP